VILKVQSRSARPTQRPPDHVRISIYAKADFGRLEEVQREIPQATSCEEQITKGLSCLANERNESLWMQPEF
jgi:hypothetical protein